MFDFNYLLFFIELESFGLVANFHALYEIYDNGFCFYVQLGNKRAWSLHRHGILNGFGNPLQPGLFIGLTLIFRANLLESASYFISILDTKQAFLFEVTYRVMGNLSLWLLLTHLVGAKFYSY